MTPTAAATTVRERVKHDFRSGVRAGVVTTPALFQWRDGRAERVELADVQRAVSP